MKLWRNMPGSPPNRWLALKAIFFTVLVIILVRESELLCQRPHTIVGQTFNYGGRVMAAASGRPINNANVLLFACDGPPSRGDHLFATTDADGNFRFTNVRWARVGVRVTHAGFVPVLWQLICASPVAPAPASIDLQLKPSAIPVEMKDGLILTSYGAGRPGVRFRSGTLDAGSSVLQFVTEDCVSGCKDKGWRYDRRAQALEPGPVPAYSADKSSWSYDPSKPPKPSQLTPSGPPDWWTIGAYQVEFDANISHGCDDTMLARKPGGKEFVVSKHSCGWQPSPDGTVIFWADANEPNYENHLWAFNFESRKRVHVVLPTAMGDFLAVGRDGDGFLVAYEVVGSCLADNTDFIRNVEGIPANQPQQEVHVCFVHVSLPDGI